jgi:hypothetical protein
MKTRSAISMLIVVFLLAVSTSATSPDDVLNLWKKNYGNIDSLALDISYADCLVKVSDPNRAKKSTYLIKNHRLQQGDKFFATIITQRTPSEEPFTTQTSYDGKVQKIYHPAKKEGNIVARDQSNFEWNALKNYLLATPGTPLIEQVLTKPREDQNYKLSECGPNTLNGVACEGFKLFKDGEKFPKYELWVAADKGMLPMLFKQFGRTGKVFMEMEVLETEQSKGLWYPKKARNSVNGDSEEFVHEIVVDKFVLNPEIDPNIFNLMFPSGTKVIDGVKREFYTVP